MSQIVVSVHQPNFMPWLKLLDKILASDVYVAYDTVQYTKSEYHSRQKVKQQSGPVWLSVPSVSARGSYQILEDVRIDDGQRFGQKHLRVLRQAYGRAPHFDEVYSMVEDVYTRHHQFLVDLNLDIIEAFCRYLGSDVRIIRASSLAHGGDNTERLVQLVRHAGGDTHLTSTFDTERQYFDWLRVQQAGITIRQQLFDHPTYHQPWGDFIPHLAAIDMLFCLGPKTGEILETSRRIVDVSPLDTTVEAGMEVSPARADIAGG